MTFPNSAGPDGTKLALLASNPDHHVPPVPEHAHPDVADVLASHDARISALEGTAPARPDGEQESS